MRPAEPFFHPFLQPIMTLQAESFVCRRCRTDNLTSHESFDSAYHFHPEVEVTLIENSHGTRLRWDTVTHENTPQEVDLPGPKN